MQSLNLPLLQERLVQRLPKQEHAEIAADPVEQRKERV